MNVVKLHANQQQDLVQVDSPDPVAVADAAMEVFNDMMAAGCSLRDCLAAVFEAGIEYRQPTQRIRRSKKPAIPPCPYTAIVDLYHASLPSLPAVALMNDSRRRSMRAFWCWIFESRRRDGTARATTPAEGLAWIEEYFSVASANDFIMGRGRRSAGHEHWQADFDYVISSGGMKQVIEKTRQQG